MKKLLAATAILILANSVSAHAEVIDVSTIKCSEAIAMPKDEMSYVLIWLHGYYGGKAGDTTIDLTALGDVGTAIGAKCAQSPGLGLMTAIEQLTK